MKSTIEINNLKIRARHGVLPRERAVGNDFTVTVHLRYPIDRAMESDSVDDTLNYAEIVEIIKTQMAQPSALLEHVAGRIRQELLSRYPSIEGGMIRVAKLRPPLQAQMDDAAVRVEW